jgi:hypothetical protein
LSGSDELRPIEYLMMERAPVRSAVKHVISKLSLGSFEFRYRIEALQRMQYAYIMYQAAKLAAKLGQPRISVLEFGVAGGGGLLWMERYASEIERMFPVEIEIYGFDTGAGLPPPVDYRDLPYHWKEGFFAMDKAALETKLKRAKLVMGNVADTCTTFFSDFNPAPIGAVAHDLDFYSSTADGLKLFDSEPGNLMPRMFCYFDDTIGSDIELYSDFTGERLAIEEYNEANRMRKIAVPHYLRASEGLGTWRHQIWVCHLFDHPDYNRFVGEENQQLPLAGR